MHCMCSLLVCLSMVTSRTNFSLRSPLQSLKAFQPEERRAVKLKTNFSNVTWPPLLSTYPGRADLDHWQRPPDLADLDLLSIYSIL